MLKWALIFFLVSLVAGVLGFTNIASGARTISRALFLVALLAAVAFLLFLFMTSGWW